MASAGVFFVLSHSLSRSENTPRIAHTLRQHSFTQFLFSMRVNSCFRFVVIVRYIASECVSLQISAL